MRGTVLLSVRYKAAETRVCMWRQTNLYVYMEENTCLYTGLYKEEVHRFT